MWQSKIAYMSNVALKGLGIELFPSTKDQRIAEGREVRREKIDNPKPGKRTREEAGLIMPVKAKKVPEFIDAEPEDR
jgi:hypothetical protein